MVPQLVQTKRDRPMRLDAALKGQVCGASVSIVFEHKRDVADAAVLGIRLDLESQFPTHFQHDGIFLENLAVYAVQAFGFRVFDSRPLRSRSEC